MILKNKYLLVITLLISAFNIVHHVVQAQSTNFFFDAWNPKDFSIDGFESRDEPSGLPDASVMVDLDVKINKVSPCIFGNNSVVWATRLYDQPKFVQHVTDLNPHVLRFPGGSLSDTYFWDATPETRPVDIPPDMDYWAGQNTPSWSMSLDDYYKLLNSTNSEGSICINYGYARYGLSEHPVNQAAHYAADWVRYDNGRTTFWEIGNENFGSWEAGHEINTDLNKDGQPKTISGQLYGQHFKVFADSMRNAAASIGHQIKIGAVAMESKVTYDQVMQNWNSSMMQETGDVADYYIVHSYYTPYQENSSPSVILNSASKTASYQEYVWNDLQKAGFNKVPVALTEWNIFAEGSSQQVSNIAGLHAALVLGQLMNNGYGFATRWDLVNGWGNGNDHGMFSYGGEPNVPTWNPRPAFYYMYYFQKFSGDWAVQAVVNNDEDIEAYATIFNSGETGIIVVNKTSEQKIVKITIKDFSPGQYYYYSLEGGGENLPFSRKVFVNGQTTTYAAGGPGDYVNIKPFGNVAVANRVKVEVGGYGAVFLVAALDDKITGIEDVAENNFRVYPNPSTHHFHFEYSKPVLSTKILDLNGNIVFSRKFDHGIYTADISTNLKPGFYILQLYTEDQLAHKVILVK